MTKHLLNLNYPYQKTWDRSKDYLSIELKDVDCSLANGLRRIMKAEIPTVGFRIFPYEESTLKIIMNDSPLDNEMLSQRIGLTPLHINPKKFDVNDYLFILEKENPSSKDFLEITSQDFQIKKLSENKLLTKEQVRKIFPPSSLTGEYISLTLLKPWENLAHEKPKIHIEGKAVISTKKEHALFSQVAAITCSHKVDPETAEEAFQKYLEDKKADDYKEDKILAEYDPEYQVPDRDYSPEKHRTTFDSLERKRHYYKDENQDPYWFQMNIESIGVLPPIIILDQAIEILANKVIKFQMNMENEHLEQIIVKKGSQGMDDAYRFIIKGEDHTLGNLFQSMFYKYFMEEKDVLNHIAYENPHPLYKRIDLVIRPKKDYGSHQELYQNIIKEGCNNILILLKDLRAELTGLPEFRESGGKSTTPKK